MHQLQQAVLSRSGRLRASLCSCFFLAFEWKDMGERVYFSSCPCVEVFARKIPVCAHPEQTAGPRRRRLGLISGGAGEKRGSLWLGCLLNTYKTKCHSNKTHGCIAPWCCLYACFKDLTSENIYPVLPLLVLSVTEPIPPSHPADPRHTDVCTSC